MPVIFNEKRSVWGIGKNNVLLSPMKPMRHLSFFMCLAFWVLILAALTLEFGFHVLAGHDSSFDWMALWGRLLSVLPFFILFLIHRLLLLPMLRRTVSGRIPWGYFISLGGLLLLLALYCFVFARRPDVPAPGAMPDGGYRPITPELMKFLLGLLLILADLGLDFFVSAMESEARMSRLRAENLSRQMDALRYQVNPHFFMNTLNNIHALVDIDAEKAKESIVRFSRMMRSILYEGDGLTVPLRQELDLVRQYIPLVGLRYPDTVRLEVDLPEADGGAEILPLSLLTCIENAFKHGVDMRKPSFVRVSVRVADGKVCFHCVNSLKSRSESAGGGAGLTNLRKRLDLLYGKSYVFETREDEARFELYMEVPVKKEVQR